MRAMFQFLTDTSMPEFYAFLAGQARAQRNEWIEQARLSRAMRRQSLAEAQIRNAKNAHRRFLASLADYRRAKARA